MIRRALWTILALLVCGMGITAAAPPGLHPHGRVGVHGMVVFGRAGTGLYMSHVPMFRSPHDWQAYFKVTFPATQTFQDGLYTFEPDRFSLDDLLMGHLSTMHGKIYRGSFEGDGKPMGTVTAKVERIVIATPLKSNSPVVPDLEYQVIGSPSDAYLFHPIGHGPDFDQILRLDLAHSTLTSDDIARGVRLVVPGRRNRVEDRLEKGTFRVAVRGTARQVQITTARELSVLIGPMFDSAPK